MKSASVKLLRTQSDERLVALAAAGHERAFEAIVERYRRTLLRHCRRYLPEARAEDALQQALVAAWSALQRGDEVRELRPWLHRIVHNTSLNALRSAGYDYEQLRETLEGDGGPAELAERDAVVRQTLAGLAALPERQREALLQIAVEGRSQDEVAEDLGVSHGAVRQLVHRARRSLRTAATALMPLPLAGWLASGGGESRGDLVARVAELVAGAGGGATLAKAGAVAVVAGGAVGAPVVVDRVSERPTAPEPRAAAAAPARPDAERPARSAAPAEPVAVAELPQVAEAPEPAVTAGQAGAGDDPSSERGGGDEARRDGARSVGDGEERGEDGRAEDEADRSGRDEGAGRPDDGESGDDGGDRPAPRSGGAGGSGPPGGDDEVERSAPRVGDGDGEEREEDDDERSIPARVEVPPEVVEDDVEPKPHPAPDASVDGASDPAGAAEPADSDSDD